jgi:hypothetical protein
MSVQEVEDGVGFLLLHADNVTSDWYVVSLVSI